MRVRPADGRPGEDRDASSRPRLGDRHSNRARAWVQGPESRTPPPAPAGKPRGPPSGRRQGKAQPDGMRLATTGARLFE